MKKIFYSLFLITALFFSCQKEEEPNITAPTEQTVFIYMPWANNLLYHFQNNISDFESAITKGILKNERVVVFLSTSSTEASMFELKYENGKCIRETIKEYDNPAFTTSQGITAILNDVLTHAPAKRYGMVVGCHGMGWIPVKRTQSRSVPEKEYWEYEGVPKTRWFGGTSSEFQTDVTTLAEGITTAGIKMEYILFDDCYMSSIEAAYDLRHVTDYIVGCPTEVMVYGMPYATMAEYLIGNVDYEGMTNAFLDFYSTYSVMPCGTIGVTICSELDNLVVIMKSINGAYTLDPLLLSKIQCMDGYSPTRFFDLQDYVRHLCPDDIIFNEFEKQLERTVPSKYRKHTSHFYTMSRGKIFVDTFSGTTISDPSISSYTSAKMETAWYRATH